MDYNEMTDALLKAGLNVPDSFFQAGSLAGKSFGEGFASGLENAFSKLKSSALKGTEGFIGGAGEGSVQNGTKVYITYQFASAGETVSHQLETAKRAGEIEKMRGELSAYQL